MSLETDNQNLSKMLMNAERENNELRELVRLITIEEVSDSGRTFCPTQITSCRCMDLEKIHNILQKYK
jgi:hypothetical protein